MHFIARSSSCVDSEGSGLARTRARRSWHRLGRGSDLVARAGAVVPRRMSALMWRAIRRSIDSPALPLRQHGPSARKCWWMGRQVGEDGEVVALDAGYRDDPVLVEEVEKTWRSQTWLPRPRIIVIEPRRSVRVVTGVLPPHFPVQRFTASRDERRAPSAARPGPGAPDEKARALKSTRSTYAGVSPFRGTGAYSLRGRALKATSVEMTSPR